MRGARTPTGSLRHLRACRHLSPKVPETTIIADNPGASVTSPAWCPAQKQPANPHLPEPLTDEERVFCKQEVTGSIPVGSTREVPIDATVSRRTRRLTRRMGHRGPRVS